MSHCQLEVKRFHMTTWVQWVHPELTSWGGRIEQRCRQLLAFCTSWTTATVLQLPKHNIRSRDLREPLGRIEHTHSLTDCAEGSSSCVICTVKLPARVARLARLEKNLYQQRLHKAPSLAAASNSGSSNNCDHVLGQAAL